MTDKLINIYPNETPPRVIENYPIQRKQQNLTRKNHPKKEEDDRQTNQHLSKRDST